jgi:hypothetical protein
MGETFICLDANLSHPPEAIPAILECLDETVSILCSAADMFWGEHRRTLGVIALGQ